MPLPRGLIRRPISVRVNEAERLALEHRAKLAHQHVSNYIRTMLGLPARNAGRPLREEIEREANEAWDLLAEAGLDPDEFFPADESWLQEYRQQDRSGGIDPPLPPPPGGWR